MLRESVTESVLGLTDVEEITLGTMDTVDQVGGRTSEPLSDLEGLFGALDGADAAEAVELGVSDCILAGGWVRGGVVKVAMGVGRFELDVSAETVTRDGNGEVQEGAVGIRDGPGEFEVGVK
eukprot:g47238.t1